MAMESSVQEKFNSNLEVLDEVLSHLDLVDLKSVRFVCKSWAFAGGRAFSHKVLVAHEPSSLANLEEVAQFLAKHHIRHTLKLSLLMKFPWPCDRDYYPAYSLHSDPTTNTIAHFKPYFTQNNCELYVDCISKMLLQPLATTNITTELYLELMLRDAGDAGFLVSILTQTTHLRKLALVLVNSTDEGVQSLPLNFKLPPTFQSLGFRLFVKQQYAEAIITGHEYPEQWTPESYIHFLKVFEKRLRFLDCTSYPLTRSHLDCHAYKVRSCSKALKSICDLDDLALPRLEGIRVNLINYVRLTPIPRRLKYLAVTSASHDEYSGVEQNDFRREPFVPKTLLPYASSLRICQLFLYPRDEGIICRNTMPVLPVLEELSIMQRSAFDETDTRSSDVMSLRLLFLVSNELGGFEKFCSVLPCLKSLTFISVPFVESTQEFTEMFPGKDESGLPIEIPQLEFLVVSMATDCLSPELSQVIAMFPQLKVLRHLRKVECGFGVCDHQRTLKGSLTSGHLTGKVLPKEPLMQNSFHQLRLRSHEYPFFYSYVEPDEFQIENGD